jgi:hypothetical protein
MPLTDPRGLYENLHILLDLPSTDPQFPWRVLHKQAALPTDIDERLLPWELREQLRFATNRYQPVPWSDDLAPIPAHYLHLSTDKAGFVAFTPNGAKGAADLQTVMKPGRYLTRFYPDLPAHRIRDIQSAVHRATELKFAVTPDAIEDVYTRGPTSCMSSDASEYESPCHPVRVYGNSDLQLAYITDADGDPTARALVWPDKKLHGRIYGDAALLAHLLKAAGYTRGELEGARIRRINQDTYTVVLPYIDGIKSFGVLDNTWLVIGGDHDAESTTGLAPIRALATCEHCSDKVPEADTGCVNGECWCQSCRDTHTFISDYSGDLFPASTCQDVIVRRRNNRRMTEQWSTCERDNLATYCGGTHAWYRTDNFRFVTLKNGETWVKWYFDQHRDRDDLAPESAPDRKPVATRERAAA